MKILITGATGFIGGALLREAQARQWETTALYRGSRPQNSGADWRSLDELETGAGGRYDVVVHAAALRHRHGVAAEEYTRNNHSLTARVLDLARHRTDRLVYVSSIAVYGWPRELPIDESFPMAPAGPYGQSKVDCEQQVRSSGLPFTIVQPSITYGPGDTNGMMDKILRMAARRRFIVCGLGTTRVQLVYIDDLARLTLDAAVAERTRGQTFICTYRDPIQMRDLAQESARAVDGWVPPVGPPKLLLTAGALGLELLERVGLFRGGEPPMTREKLATVSVDRAYRIDRMRALLGDEPRVGYAEGLGRTAEALSLGARRRECATRAHHGSK